MRFKSLREKLDEKSAPRRAAAAIELERAAMQRGLAFDRGRAQAYHPANPRIRACWTDCAGMFSVYGDVPKEDIGFATAADCCEALLAENVRYAAQQKVWYFIQEMNLCD